MKNKITHDDHEKLKVLNLLMWLQASLYAADECETVKWFYNHQTKMLMKRLNESIQREHGKTITELLNVTKLKRPTMKVWLNSLFLLKLITQKHIKDEL